jgi:hypothetical protein
MGLDLLFSELFLMQKKFQENPDIVLEVEKYSENSENSKKIPRDRLIHEQSK